MADETTKKQLGKWSCNTCGDTKGVVNGVCPTCGPTQTTPVDKHALKEAGVEEEAKVEEGEVVA